MRTLSFYFGLRAYKPHYMQRTTDIHFTFSHVISLPSMAQITAVPNSSGLNASLFRKHPQDRPRLYYTLYVLPTATFHNWLEFTTCSVHQSLLNKNTSTAWLNPKITFRAQNYQSPCIFSMFHYESLKANIKSNPHRNGS